MTDKQFKSLIARTHKAALAHQILLAQANAEYERRWGHNPADNDHGDYWIGSLHLEPGVFPPDFAVIEMEALRGMTKEGLI